jgi:hypothetical protein
MSLLMQGPAEFKTFFANEVVAWGKVVKENNIKGE